MGRVPVSGAESVRILTYPIIRRPCILRRGLRDNVQFTGHDTSCGAGERTNVGGIGDKAIVDPIALDVETGDEAGARC